MGNKIAFDLNTLLKGKEISTNTLKKIYIQYSEDKDVNSRISKTKALDFVNDLFKIYDLPQQNDQKVRISINNFFFLLFFFFFGF